MLFLCFTRLMAFLGTDLLNRFAPANDLCNSIFFAALFGHYFLHIVYSRKRAASYFKLSPRLFLTGALMFLFYVAQFTSLLPMAIFFGMHFLFTEVYSGRLAASNFLTRLFHWVATISIYGLMMWNSVPFLLIPKSIYIAAAAVSCLGYLALIARSLRKSEIFGFLAYDIIGLIGAFTTIGHGNDLRNVIFYHLVWWAIYPLRSIRGRHLAWYVTQTVVLTGGLFLLMPSAGLVPISMEKWLLASFAWGNAHIIASVLLSRQNPRFVNWLFYGRESQPAALAPSVLKNSAPSQIQDAS